MNPYRIDPDNVPVFTHSQIDEYGFPDWYGYEIYRVIETTSCIQVVSGFSESVYSKRPIHRYCRIKRFTTILHHLLNDVGKVPNEVIDLVREHMFPNRPIWDEVRTVLKENKLRIYYNRIPFIVQKLTRTQPTQKVTFEMYQNIFKEFHLFINYFETNKKDFGRTYFPNMRYIALKLLTRWGVFLNYEIPFIRTFRKFKELEMIWDRFINTITEFCMSLQIQ